MDEPPVMGSKWETIGSIVNVHQKACLVEKTPNYHVNNIFSLCILVSFFPQILQLLLNRLKSKVALVSRIKVMPEFNITGLTSPRLSYLLLLINQLAAGIQYGVPFQGSQPSIMLNPCHHGRDGIHIFIW